MHVPGIKEHFDEVVQDGYQRERRGLLVWLSTDGKVENLKPPTFVSAPSWRHEPLLINTPHSDLLQALSTYDSTTSYIVLVANSNLDNTTTVGWYTWWVGLFAQDADNAAHRLAPIGEGLAATHLLKQALQCCS